MVQPIQYVTPGAFDPFNSLMQGVRLGATFEEMQAARQQREMQQQQMLMQQQALQQKAMQEQAMRAALDALASNPNPTFQDYQRVALQLPKDQAESVLKTWDKLDESRKSGELAFGGQVFAAVKSKPDLAISMLRERAAAERNKGREDQAKAYETWASIAEQSPEAARDTIGVMLSRLPGGDKIIEAMTKLGVEGRAERQFGPDLRTAEAAAKKAETELQTLGLVKQAELRKAQNDAEKAAIEAKFAERQQQAELRLRNAQTLSAQATAEKTSFERDRMLRELQEGPAPTYNPQAGGFIYPPSQKNPSGAFVPLDQPKNAADQRAAVKALATAGYNVETGEDKVSEDILKSTGGLVQTLGSAALAQWGVSTSGAKAISRLATAANSIATDILGGKLGAGISNTDREFILASLGDIANSSIPTETRLAGWRKARDRMIITGMIPPPTNPPKTSRGASPLVSPEEQAGQRNITVDY